ncbi:hypothetical protein [Hydrogenoanaerobacterium saccharovorans]|uniref:hypothetical protein n=1 Tax=Hydrogenoanaerobacterium saccharovorans TaxID=474960 RepID=UPI000A831EB9
MGHKDAILFIEDIAKKDVKIDEFIIKQIHSLVLLNSPEDKGVYRRIPVMIMGAFTDPVQPYLKDDRTDYRKYKPQENNARYRTHCKISS